MVEAHVDIAKQVRIYIGVLIALAVFTVLTVVASRVQASVGTHVTIALLIAVVKASLVAAIFMHLRWEKTAVLWLVLAVTAFFFAALMVLPMLTMGELPAVGEYGMWG